MSQKQWGHGYRAGVKDERKKAKQVHQQGQIEGGVAGGCLER